MADRPLARFGDTVEGDYDASASIREIPLIS